MLQNREEDKCFHNNHYVHARAFYKWDSFRLVSQSNLLDSCESEPSTEQSFEHVRKVFVEVKVQIVKLRGRDFEDGVSLLDQSPHDRDVLELFAV